MPRTRICSALLVALLVAGASSNGRTTSQGSVQSKKLTAPAPSWWTPEMRDRAIRAGAHGVPLTSDQLAVVRTSSLAYLGIRPGQLLLVETADGTSLCTSNFVFYTGTTPTYYIGTAGHCGVVGNDVFMLYLPKGLVRLGKIVKSTGDPGESVSKTDFALISIDPALNPDVSPSMAYWGGPTGVFTGGGVQPVLHAGWGLVIGTGGTPRAGAAYAWRIGSEYRFEGAVTPGDSGSGAIVAGGLAAGNVTHVAVDTRETVPVWNGGTTMTAILQYLGSTYKLATCSLAVPWPAPGCPPA